MATKASPEMVRVGILDALERATAEDLQALKGEIQEAERRLDSLRAAYRLVKIKIEGKPTREKKTKASPSTRGTTSENGAETSTMRDKRLRVLDYLISNGPRITGKLSDATGISKYGPGSISQVVQHPFFHVSPDGLVSVTAAGESAAKAEAATKLRGGLSP